MGFNVETLNHKGTAFTVWDAAGQQGLRNLWSHYYKAAKGIIFVVDSSDQERLDDGDSSAKSELQNMVSDEQLSGIPLLIFCNKQDMDQASQPEDIKQRLGVASIIDRNVTVVGCVATTGHGLDQGLDWLSAEMKKSNEPK